MSSLPREYKPGDYEVGVDIPDEVAQRALAGKKAIKIQSPAETIEKKTSGRTGKKKRSRSSRQAHRSTQSKSSTSDDPAVE